MREALPFGAEPSSFSAAQNGHDFLRSALIGTIVPDDQWFMRLAHGLWPTKTTAWLHSLTGFPIRTCFAYANAEREPSGPFLIALLLSDQGERFLVALFDQAPAGWFAALREAKRKADAFKAA